ncbi:hypothetical protein S40288_04685 [Stachybotrys chartarum IBT 40288]|nr:hypothetical protein S40288_04685 [Stachybotrys chartarum IBT 40288]
MAFTISQADAIRFSVIVNNEVDPISPSPNINVTYPAFLTGVPLSPLAGNDRGGAVAELRLDSICCGAHGLSLKINIEAGAETRTLLFDAGPEEDVFEKNVQRMRLKLDDVEHVHLSHWHRDHSGGLPRAIELVSKARAKAQKPPITVEVHPDRPDYRGMRVNDKIVSMEADPTFDSLGSASTGMTTSSAPHTVLGGCFLVSGEVPRRTDYELGVRGGLRYVKEENAWVEDELIRDERFIVCHLRGKGLVVFAGCSHPGIVNICRHASELTGGNIPLYAIVGGFHLADGDPIKMRRSLDDLMALKPQIFMPAHCTGWRFCFMIERELPGSYAPCFGGTTYRLDGEAQ